jgi:hypothetical protein
MPGSNVRSIAGRSRPLESHQVSLPQHDASWVSTCSAPLLQMWLYTLKMSPLDYSRKVLELGSKFQNSLKCRPQYQRMQSRCHHAPPLMESWVL